MMSTMSAGARTLSRSFASLVAVAVLPVAVGRMNTLGERVVVSLKGS